MPQEAPSRVAPADDVLCETVQDEVILFKLADQQYYRLDSIGAHTWSLLCENGDVAAVASLLSETYSGDADVILRDLRALVADLIEADLLRVMP